MSERKTRPAGAPSGSGRVPSDAQTGAIIDLLRVFTTAMNRYVDVRGGSAGMHRTELHALAHVMDAARSGRDMSPSELADAVNLSPPATSALLSRLEAAGHVRRAHDSADRRRVTIHVSDEAMDVGRTIFSPIAEAIGEVVTTLSPDERDTVIRFLSEVVTATTRSTGSPG